MKAELNSASSHSVQLLKNIEQLKSKLGTSKCIQGDRDTTVAHYEMQTVLKKLLLTDLEYALDHKAEQELWNTCFKCQITLMQTNAKDKKIGAKQKEWQATLHLFLDSALGFYTALLNQLCQMYDIDLPFRRKDAVLFGSFADENRPPASAPSRSSCCYVVQDCLVHMGDIARYRGRAKQAESFYRHAVKLVPTSGQPYNQLALLEAHHGDRISPVYYYVRSLAVRTPFPAATTNLSKLYSRLATQGPALEGRRHLSAADYTMLFLQLQARLQQRCEPRALRPLLIALSTSLPRLLLAEALSPWRLLQMLVISVQSAAAAAGRPDGGAPLELTRLPEPQQRLVAAALEPSAATLDALLRCSYRLETTEQRRRWPLLPVVRLYVCWLADWPQVLTTEPFTTRPQLWAHLCHLVNGLEVTPEMVTEAVENSLPLPEDVDLAGFLPLSGSQRTLRLARPPVPAAAQATVRAGRLRAACQRLTGSGVVWGAAPAGRLETAYQTEPSVVLQQLTLAESGADSWPPTIGSETGQDPTSPSEQLTPGAGDPAQTGRPSHQPAEAKGGILKAEGGGTGRRRQNVALQALMRSGPRPAPPGDEPRSRESRQVTFRTPSPPTPAQTPTPNVPRPAPVDNRPPRLCEPRRPPPGPAGLSGGLGPAGGPAPPAAGVWPPPRPRHPLEDSPPAHFNPSVPPPGWSGAQPAAQPQPPPPPPPPQEPLRLPWGGWAMAGPSAQQPSPLAAMLSQVRVPAPAQGPGPGPEPPGRRPDELGVYSLFPSAPAPEMTSRGAAYSLFPSAGMQHPLWPSAGPSPLERLIEQQRQQSRRGDP
ncbi:Protein SMG7 [Amphibalanus amphitrite]|uniref:Protein SMG7 n=1 Tax=Amphibalanus amphitrite TaxID=1232801 RepID=A0A6A4X2Q8_AMPAM|nr:protein SMG7-like [Amphibalanus amphitrite]KAF0310380.1 Protein SMG7 [Amphibalanus amphitrite]